MSKDFTPKRVVVTYRCEGIYPPDVEYALIETDKGLAVHERVHGKKGALTEDHWEDSDGDHFIMWIQVMSTKGPAYEFVVPSDRTKVARRYVYQSGAYTILKLGNTTRPVPNHPQKTPMTWLIPAEELSTQSAWVAEMSRRFHDDVGGFSYVPPKGMILMDLPSHQFKVPVGKPVDGFSPVAIIVKEPVRPGLKQRADEAIVSGYAIIEKVEFVTDSGIKGIHYIAEDEERKGKTKRVIAFCSVPTRGHIYSICCVSPVGSGNVTDDVFNDFLKSFDAD